MMVGLFISTLTDRPASFKAVGHRSRYFCRQLEHKAATLALMAPHIARAINRATTFKQKEIERNRLPPTPVLLTKK